MYRTIVAGTDLSGTARIATDRAAWLAQTTGAALRLVHAGSSRVGDVEGLARAYGAEAVVKAGHPRRRSDGRGVRE